MSAVTAKADRRAVRRALGDEGLKQVHALTTLVTATVIPSVAAQLDTINQQSRELDHVFERLERLEAESKARKALTRWGRLCWVWTGH